MAEENPAGEETKEIDWKAMSRKHEDRAKELAAELKQVKEQLESLKGEAESKTTLEQQLTDMQKQLDDLRNTNAEKDREILLERVSNAKGVPAKYLRGDTEEDLAASADEYLADVEKRLEEATSKKGYVGSQGTGDPNPSPSSFESGAERARARHAKN